MDGHRPRRHPLDVRQARLSRPAADGVVSVLRARGAVLRRRESAAGGDACAVGRHVSPVPRSAGDVRVLRHGLRRRRPDRQRPPRERAANLSVEAADAPRVRIRQACDPRDVSAARHLGARDRAADRADVVRRQLHVSQEQSVPVPGHYRVHVHRGAAGGDDHACPVVTLEQQPLRGHPLRGCHLLQLGDLRSALRSHAQHCVLVDFVSGEPRADWQRDLPPAVAVRHAVAAVALHDHPGHRVVRRDPRAPRSRRRGRRMSAVEQGAPAVVPEERSAASRDSSIVAAEHLSKWYGQVIGLNDVTLAVPPGITGLLGPNGAGKSTFMKLITGQLKPSKGSITVLGEPIWANPALYFRIGFCPEQDAFYERMTGLEWVTALVRLNGLSDTEATETARRALELVELLDAADKKIGAYSKGMRQRVKMAQALAHEPQLLILDEPLSGMDPIMRRKTIRMIKDWGRAGKSIIVSSHI